MMSNICRLSDDLSALCSLKCGSFRQDQLVSGLHRISTSMSHITTPRLTELSQQALICDPWEVRHLRNCECCTELLRFFAVHYRAIRDEWDKPKDEHVY